MMRARPFRFLSVHTICRPVGTIAEVFRTPNSILREAPDEPIDFRPVEFLDPADAQDATRLVSRERNRESFSVGFDSSEDHFVARLDDVTIHRLTFHGFECFRIFLDRGVALSEPYAAHYKADWFNVRRLDAVNMDMDGVRVPIYMHHELEPEIVVDDPVMYMLDKGAKNYYHWMCEVLPRVRAHDREPAFHSLPMLVNDSELLPFQRQTLGILNPAHVSPFPWRCARFKRLYLSSFLSAGEVAPRLRPWFRELRSRLGSTPLTDAPRRLYLSRRDATRRRVTNDAEVAAALQQFGFESVTLDGRSVAEQLELFAGAEAIVFPHGAAGGNLPAAPAGTLVIECHARSLLNPSYWLLTQAMKHRYGIVASGDDAAGEPDYLADMTVDIPKLLRVVDAGLKGR
jgi:hypothetical protein